MTPSAVDMSSSRLIREIKDHAERLAPNIVDDHLTKSGGNITTFVPSECFHVSVELALRNSKEPTVNRFLAILWYKEPANSLRKDFLRGPASATFEDALKNLHAHTRLMVAAKDEGVKGRLDKASVQPPLAMDRAKSQALEQGVSPSKIVREWMKTCQPQARKARTSHLGGEFVKVSPKDVDSPGSASTEDKAARTTLDKEDDWVMV